MQTEKPVEWVSMGEDEDYVMRPVMEGMCLYESLIECRIDLADIARMNDAIDARAENTARYRKANE